MNITKEIVSLSHLAKVYDKKNFFNIALILIFFTSLGWETNAHAAEEIKIDVPPQGDVNNNVNYEGRQFPHFDLYPTGLFLKKGEKLVVTTSSVEDISVVIGQAGTYYY